MSATTGSKDFPRRMQSDAENIEAARAFNTPNHDQRSELGIENSPVERRDSASQEDDEKPDVSTADEESRMASLVLSPPPDGGLTAWLQVFMGHLMNFNTWGFINSYGLFGAYYINDLKLSASEIAWIPSTQIFLLCFVGMFSGRALDAGFYRHTLMLGCFFQLLGIFMTSLARSYWQLFLAQGICQGLGNGLVFCPTISLVSTYFVKKRSLAVCLTASGSATGGVVFPIIAQHLLPQLGFPWTVRIMGFVVLFNVAIIISLARTRLPPRRSGPLLELAAFREKPYAFFVVGVFLVLMPLYYAYDYVNIFATDIIHVSSSTSLTILLILNAVGFPGRVIPALLADFYIGPLNTLILFATICALLSYFWIGVTGFGGLIAWVVFYGVFNSGVQGIFLSATSSLTTDLSKMGTRIGMVLGIVSFSTLTGAPIAGALIDKDGGQFLGVQLFGGTLMLVGVGILVVARVAKTGLVWKTKM